VVHVGDIKGGGSPCNEAVYVKVSDMLSKAAAPVFILPGDNEWNDFVDPDPIPAWSHWKKHFMRFDQPATGADTASLQTSIVRSGKECNAEPENR